MIRLLQLSARSLITPSALSGSSGVAAARPSARPVYLELRQRRLISVTSPYYKQQGSSSSSSSKDHRGDKKKKSMMDKASETLENAGIKTRSKSNTGAASQQSQGLENRQSDRRDGGSISSRRQSANHSPRINTRAGSSSMDPDSDVTGQRLNSSTHRSQQKPAYNHRAAGPVRHDKKAKQFVLDLDHNQVARIEYKEIGKGRIELYHTEVPEELRGKGIGKALAKGALESASRADLKLKVTCSYLEDYLKRFADDKYRKLVE